MKMAQNIYIPYPLSSLYRLSELASRYLKLRIILFRQNQLQKYVMSNIVSIASWLVDCATGIKMIHILTINCDKGSHWLLYSGVSWMNIFVNLVFVSKLDKHQYIHLLLDLRLLGYHWHWDFLRPIWTGVNLYLHFSVLQRTPLRLPSRINHFIIKYQ